MTMISDFNFFPISFSDLILIFSRVVGRYKMDFDDEARKKKQFASMMAEVDDSDDDDEDDSDDDFSFKKPSAQRLSQVAKTTGFSKNASAPKSQAKYGGDSDSDEEGSYAFRTPASKQVYSGESASMDDFADAPPAASAESKSVDVHAARAAAFRPCRKGDAPVQV